MFDYLCAVASLEIGREISMARLVQIPAHGDVVVEMHYSELERCDSRCQQARGGDCPCSCEGGNHGEGSYASWKAVSTTTLVRATREKVVTRVLTGKAAKRQRRHHSGKI